MRKKAAIYKEGESLFFVFRFSLFVFPYSFFDIRTEDEYRILTFQILLWQSNWGRISYFDIQNPI